MVRIKQGWEDITDRYDIENPRGNPIYRIPWTDLSLSNKLNYVVRRVFLEKAFAADIKVGSEDDPGRVVLTKGCSEEVEKKLIAHELGHAQDPRLHSSVKYLTYILLLIHIPFNIGLLTWNTGLIRDSLTGVFAATLGFSFLVENLFEPEANDYMEQSFGEIDFEVKHPALMPLYLTSAVFVQFAGAMYMMYRAFFSLYWKFPEAVYVGLKEKLREIKRSVEGGRMNG